MGSEPLHSRDREALSESSPGEEILSRLDGLIKLTGGDPSSWTHFSDSLRTFLTTVHGDLVAGRQARAQAAEDNAFLAVRAAALEGEVAKLKDQIAAVGLLQSDARMTHSVSDSEINFGTLFGVSKRDVERSLPIDVHVRNSAQLPENTPDSFASARTSDSSPLMRSLTEEGAVCAEQSGDGSSSAEAGAIEIRSPTHRARDAIAVVVTSAGGGAASDGEGSGEGEGEGDGASGGGSPSLSTSAIFLGAVARSPPQQQASSSTLAPLRAQPPLPEVPVPNPLPLRRGRRADIYDDSDTSLAGSPVLPGNVERMTNARLHTSGENGESQEKAPAAGGGDPGLGIRVNVPRRDDSDEEVFHTPQRDVAFELARLERSPIDSPLSPGRANGVGADNARGGPRVERRRRRGVKSSEQGANGPNADEAEEARRASVRRRERLAQAAHAAKIAAAGVASRGSPVIPDGPSEGEPRLADGTDSSGGGAGSRSTRSRSSLQASVGPRPRAFAGVDSIIAAERSLNASIASDAFPTFPAHPSRSRTSIASGNASGPLVETYAAGKRNRRGRSGRIGGVPFVVSTGESSEIESSVAPTDSETNVDFDTSGRLTSHEVGSLDDADGSCSGSDERHKSYPSFTGAGSGAGSESYAGSSDMGGCQQGDIEADDDDEFTRMVHEERTIRDGYDDTKDGVFPYEQNIFALNCRFTFVERVSCSDDVVVYKALDRKTRMLCAVKLSRDFNNKQPKEVRIVATLQGHPCINRFLVWYALPSTRCYAVVTEFVHGVRRREIQRPEVPAYMRDVLSALNLMHARGVIYRDIKPSNTMLNRASGRAVIIDFDCATFYNHVGHYAQIGTEGYMAPEMLAAKDNDGPGYGYEVDVYSAGVLMAELLLEVYDEGETSRDEILEWMADSEDIDDVAADLVAHMLVLDPKQRISTADALAHPYFAGIPPIPDAPPLAPPCYGRLVETL